MVGGLSLCAYPQFSNYFNVRAFRGSPYGINYGSAPPFTPITLYRINLDLSIDLLSSTTIGGPTGWQGPGVILDDSRMVGRVITPIGGSSHSSGLVVLSRSGETIGFGSVQQAVTVSGSSAFTGNSGMCRIDANTIVRTWISTNSNPLPIGFIDVLGVSGTSISRSRCHARRTAPTRRRRVT